MLSVGKVAGLANLAVAAVLEVATHASFVAHVHLHVRVLHLASKVHRVHAHGAMPHVVLGHHPLRVLYHLARRSLALGILRLILLLH